MIGVARFVWQTQDLLLTCNPTIRVYGKQNLGSAQPRAYLNQTVIIKLCTIKHSNSDTATAKK